MECREYCSEDYSSLKEMLNGLQDFFVGMDDEYRRFDKNVLREYLGKIISDIERMDGKIFLALKDGRIVGFIQGVIIEKKICNIARVEKDGLGYYSLRISLAGAMLERI